MVAMAERMAASISGEEKKEKGEEEGLVPAPAPSANGAILSVDGMGSRSLYTSPVWVVGGALACLSAATVQSSRKERYEHRQEEKLRENRLVFNDLREGPDLRVNGFSARNAFFFSHLSSTMYLTPGLVEAHFRKLGITEFFWFSPPDAVTRSPFSQINDTQAAIAATEDYIAVVFRGTQEGADWWTNLKFLHRHFPSLGRVHEGFSEGLDTVWIGEGMLDKLKEMYGESPRPIFVTGHSLGAALATIAAARLAVDHDLPFKALYTMGSPRVFDRTGAQSFDNWMNHGALLSQKSFRGVNNNDIVPAVPPEFSDYQHVGTKIYINSRGSVETGQFWDGLLGTWEALTKGNFLDFVDDHDVGKYAAAFRRAAAKARMGRFKRVVMAAAACHAAHNARDMVTEDLTESESPALGPSTSPVIPTAD
eukprot:g6516.t1